jgi:hypothetical protein
MIMAAQQPNGKRLYVELTIFIYKCLSNFQFLALAPNPFPISNVPFVFQSVGTQISSYSLRRLVNQVNY